MSTAAVGIHAHRCEACAKNGKQVFWVHSDTDAGNVALHKCPQCGTVQWKKALIEPGRLPQVHNAQGAINLEALLGYIVLAVGLALIGYGAFLYVKKLRNDKTIPNLPE